MWLYLGIFSAVFLGLYDITRKHALCDNAVLPVLFFATGAGALLVSPVAVLSPLAPDLMTHLGLYIPTIGLTEHLCLFLKAVIVAAMWVFAYFSMKHLPLSIFSPIAASSPAWTLFGAIIVFGERLTAVQWAAFAVLFASFYIFSLIGSREGIVFHSNRWIIFLFAAVLLGSSSALYDKYLIQELCYPPLVVQVWFSIYIAPIMAAALLLFWYPRRAGYAPFDWRWSIPLIGLWLTIADFAYFKSLACGGTLISLLAAVRSGGAVISFLAAALLFGEVRIIQKSVVLAGVLAGVFLLFLSH
jgi:transporter family protein